MRWIFFWLRHPFQYCLKHKQEKTGWYILSCDSCDEEKRGRVRARLNKERAMLRAAIDAAKPAENHPRNG